MTFRAFSAVALLLVVAAPGAAQDINLEIRDGHVSLTARNAPVRQILAEWARVGGNTIVNGDKVAGAPVTIDLTDVPERQALDIVLRNVSGYMLAPRQAGTVGASAFDRILILPTSTPPPVPPPTAAANRPRIAPRVPTFTDFAQDPGLSNGVPDDAADPNAGIGMGQPNLPSVPGVMLPRPPNFVDPAESGATGTGMPRAPARFPGMPTGPSPPGAVSPGPGRTLIGVPSGTGRPGEVIVRPTNPNGPVTTMLEVPPPTQAPIRSRR